MLYIGIAVIVVVMVVGMMITKKRNSEIKMNGIEADAVVTRVEENVSTDADGSISGINRTYFVTYRTLNGETVEAELASGKSLDIHIGKADWDRDLHEGSRVRIKYLPDRPHYVIRI